MLFHFSIIRNLGFISYIWDFIVLWFSYTNDVNGAVEATPKSYMGIASAAARKLHMAIASAAANHENGVDDLSSVKTVLDFNFCSVNDLLMLVRISKEPICC
jgi:hypothetical protein